MKVYKSLSKYLLDKSGAVFSKEDGTQVEPMKGGLVRLVTDKIFVSRSGKRSNIVRRFTKDEILQRYNHKDAIEESKVQDQVIEKAPEVNNESKDEVRSKVIERSEGMIDDELFQYEIHGIKYRTAGEASKHLGIAVNTVTNRVKKGVEGYKSLI